MLQLLDALFYLTGSARIETLMLDLRIGFILQLSSEIELLLVFCVGIYVERSLLSRVRSIYWIIMLLVRLRRRRIV